MTKADGQGLWWEGLDPQQLYASKYTNFNAEFGQRTLELVANYRPDQLYFDDGKIPQLMVEKSGMKLVNTGVLTGPS